MNYNEFKRELQEQLLSRLGSQSRVIFHQVRKNNEVSLECIVILKEGENISPTFYLETYYQRYQEGETIGRIAAEIVGTYFRFKPSGKADTARYLNPEWAMDRIVYRLVNYRKNERLLAEMPHRRFLDLAVVYACVLELSDEGCASMPVRSSHAGAWGFSEEKLFALACGNTPRLLPHHLMTTDEVVWKDGQPEKKEFMYMLSNQQKSHGASAILYPGLPERLCRRIGGSFYVLPSSIHECILLPEQYAPAPGKLRELVKEINRTQLAPQDVLSDSVYCIRENQLVYA